MPEIKSVRDAEVAGKRVLVHVDFDVPMAEGAIVDDMRVRAALPTIALLQEKGAAKIILISKLGRPAGNVVDALRMGPVFEHLKTLVDTANIELRENLRFDPREEANDASFAQELAVLGDIFVNEAFADSHRAHASIVGVPKLLPSYLGLRFEEEIERLGEALTPPPGSIAVIGGAKFETKEPLLAKLLTVYGKVLLGGALGNDVLKARGQPIGRSLTSAVPVPPVIAGDERLLVPKDVVVKNAASNAERTALVVDTQEDECIIDVGPLTALEWSRKIAEAPFVLWNGPLGVYEQGYTDGTDVVAQAIALRSSSGQSPQFHAVIGGGDTIAALKKFTFDPAKVFVSTGGGAMLEYLTKGTLVGLEALKG